MGSKITLQLQFLVDGQNIFDVGITFFEPFSHCSGNIYEVEHIQMNRTALILKLWQRAKHDMGKAESYSIGYFTHI